MDSMDDSRVSVMDDSRIMTIKGELFHLEINFGRRG
jgi:hypothetical protein